MTILICGLVIYIRFISLVPWLPCWVSDVLANATQLTKTFIDKVLYHTTNTARHMMSTFYNISPLQSVFDLAKKKLSVLLVAQTHCTFHQICNSVNAKPRKRGFPFTKKSFKLFHIIKYIYVWKNMINNRFPLFVRSLKC